MKAVWLLTTRKRKSEPSFQGKPDGSTDASVNCAPAYSMQIEDWEKSVKETCADCCTNKRICRPVFPSSTAKQV